MELNKETIAFRKSMASDLTSLMHLLCKVRIRYTSEGLTQIITSLRNSINIPSDREFAATNNTWGYNSSCIDFELDEVPEGVQPAITSLKISLKMHIIAFYDKKKEVVDIKLLENNIIIKGYNGDSEYISTYHLDKHLNGPNEPKFPHPLYHLHYGGKEMKVDAENYNYGSLLLIDSPRIAHFPMDIFLTIDFILSNFMPAKWNSLQNEGEYVNLHRKYQKYFWRPYICSLYKHWGDIGEEQNITDSRNLLPQLVPYRES